MNAALLLVLENSSARRRTRKKAPWMWTLLEDVLKRITLWCLELPPTEVGARAHSSSLSNFAIHSLI